MSRIIAPPVCLVQTSDNRGPAPNLNLCFDQTDELCEALIMQNLMAFSVLFQLKELDLSGCKTLGEIEGLTEEFTSLEMLDISNSNITTLKNFPKLPNLRKVSISGGHLRSKYYTTDLDILGGERRKIALARPQPNHNTPLPLLRLGLT